MNATAHTLTPEEIMAFLDGELPALDAQAVAAHLESCAACSRVAGQFRQASQELKSWAAAGPAFSWDAFVLRAAGATSGGGIRGANAKMLARNWTWKQWALASGGTVAVLLLVWSASVPNLLRSRRVADGSLHWLRSEQAAGSKSFDETEGYIRVEQPTAGLKLNTRIEPGAAADSNEIPHGAGSAGDQVEDSDQIASAAPMIARTVSLSIVVKDFPGSRASLDAILARHRGYSAQLSLSTPENAPRSLQASLRIPSAELSAAVAELRTLGRVENESQAGEEVTQQHADLVARLQNSRETEQRLRGILQERTGKITDVLQVENEISRVRGDIERMEADQKELEHRVDFASVELQLSEEYKAQLNSPAPSVSTRLHNAAVAGLRSAWEMVFGIVLFLAEYGLTLLIWAAILALPAFFVWRRFKGKLASL
jgi:hypothetical protein